MSIVSVNSNTGALIALQNLNVTNTELMRTQNRINTGLKIATAKDNGATWAIAQSQRANMGSLDAVKDSLNRSISTVDVAISTGETVAEMLVTLKEKALASSDATQDATSRAAINSDFVAIRDQVTKTLTNATFNTANLTNGTTASLTPLANGAGTNVITVSGENMSLGGTILTLGATDTVATSASATALLTVIDTSITNLSAAMARLGTAHGALTRHLTFVGKLQDSLLSGIGNLVDADMAKESAKIQALQTKQQLGIQALSIANQAPRAVLSLFQ